jgi:hypothetical protein
MVRIDWPSAMNSMAFLETDQLDDLVPCVMEQKGTSVRNSWRLKMRILGQSKTNQSQPIQVCNKDVVPSGALMEEWGWAKALDLNDL